MEIEAIRGLMMIAAIVTGTTGVLALSIGWRALLALPVFGLAFALPNGVATSLVTLFIGATSVLILYVAISVHLRLRLTVPEFGRPSRRSRSASVVMLALGAATVVGFTTAIWVI